MVININLTETFIINGITLLVVLNPFLQIPTSGKLLKNMEKKNTCLIWATITALVILIIFACGGVEILKYMGISISSFSIAGGALLFIIGVQIMIRGKPLLNNHNKNGGGCAVPIGTPFMAGPGAIAVTTLMMQTDPLLCLNFFPVVTIFAIIISLFITMIFLFLSEYILNIFKEDFVNVVGRVNGIHISAIGVEYIAKGIEGFINISIQGVI